MAIISFTNYKRGQTTGCMSAVMRYTMQDKKTEFEGQQLVTGINCQPESVYADFMTTKRLYHKTDGVLFYHMVQSFPKGEAVDPVTAHAAALKLAEYYEGYEVLVCTHTDREHIHSHFLINSVNFDTGRKLHIAKEQLQELRQRNDMVCKEFSLPVFQPRETSVYKGYKQDKIEMRGDRAEMSDFPLYLNTVAGGLDRRDQTIGGFSFVVKIYAVPVVEIRFQCSRRG